MPELLCSVEGQVASLTADCAYDGDRHIHLVAEGCRVAWQKATGDGCRV